MILCLRQNKNTAQCGVLNLWRAQKDSLGINACGATVTISLRFACEIYLLSNPVVFSHDSVLATK